jgi:predicted nucleotidyltransferase
MIFHNVYDILFSAWSNIAVLRVLQHHSNGITGREIARLAGISHRTSQNALAILEGIGVVARRRGGRDHLFLLNRNHAMVKTILLRLLQYEKDFSADAFASLGEAFSHSAVSVILFGSVARREETVESDCDLCLVVKSAAMKTKTEESIRVVSSEFRQRYGANLAPFVIDQKDFAARARKKLPPVSSILKEGIVLHGKSLKELVRG